MNSFLNNNDGKTRRFDKNKKPYDSRRYDNFSQRNNQSNQDSEVVKQVSRNLQKLVETIQETKNEASVFLKRIASAQERIADSIQSIAGHFEEKNIPSASENGDGWFADTLSEGRNIISAE